MQKILRTRQDRFIDNTIYIKSFFIDSIDPSEEINFLNIFPFVFRIAGSLRNQHHPNQLTHTSFWEKDLCRWAVALRQVLIESTRLPSTFSTDLCRWILFY